MKGDVFTDDQIDPYISLKLEEIARFEIEPQPTEFAMCCGIRRYPRLEALAQWPLGVIDVRFWLTADTLGADFHVRLAPDSGHIRRDS